MKSCVTGKRLIILAGPHKTASSYIQSSLFSLSQKRVAGLVDNFYMPTFNGDSHPWKVHQYIATYFLTEFPERTDTFSQVEALFEEMFSSPKDILICSEVFDKLDVMGVTRLRAKFEPHFSKILVVLTYREMLSHMLSQGNQQATSPNPNIDPFLSHFFVDMNQRAASQTSAAINAMVRVVGRENVTIVDYYGVQAADKDILVAILEVIGVKNASDVAAHLNSSDDVHNNLSKTELVERQFVAILNDFRILYGCPEIVFKSGKVLSKSKQNLLKKFPMMKIDLSLFVHLSGIFDSKLRGDLGDRIVFGNRTQNLLAAHNVKYEEVDVRAVIRDKVLMNKIKKSCV